MRSNTRSTYANQKGNLPADTEYGQKRKSYVHLEVLKVQDLMGSAVRVPLKAKKSIAHEAMSVSCTT